MKKYLIGLALLTALVSCEKEKRDCPSSTQKQFSETGFTRITAGETFRFTIKQGATYSLVAKGCSQDLNDLRIAILPNRTLDIHYNRYQNNRFRVDFEITMPLISNLSLSGEAKATVSGFEPQPGSLEAHLSGKASCTIESLPLLIDADLSGASQLTLTGASPDLIAHLSGDSKLHAYGATFSDADVYTSGSSKAQVVVQQSLFAQASGDSRIYYKGNPTSVNVEQSGTTKVIKE